MLSQVNCFTRRHSLAKKRLFFILKWSMLTNVSNYYSPTFTGYGKVDSGAIQNFLPFPKDPPEIDS